MSALSGWWQGLAERERRMLAIGAACVGLLLGYLLLVEPLLASREDLRRRAEAAELNLRWMQGTAAEVARLRGSAGPATPRDGRSLLARVDSGARAAGLGGALLRVEPTGAHQVRVQLQQAPFDALMQWLEAMAQHEGVQVAELSATRADGVGLVDARLLLTEPEH